MTRPQTLRSGDLAALLPRRGTVLVQGCSGASDRLAEMVAMEGEALGALEFTGIQVPGVNHHEWLANPRCRFTTVFMTPELRAAGSAVTFLPLSYGEILRRWRTAPPEAALFSVSPPDEHGTCSFGPTVDFLAELWPRIPLRIAQINPLLPRTSGPTGIPFNRLHAVVEAEDSLPMVAETEDSPVASSIAKQIAAFIDDGATLQTGLGALPGAMLRALRDHRRLRIHSGLIGNATLDLLEAGAIDKGSDVVTGVAIGTRRLYDALSASGIAFHPVSHTHSPGVLATLANLVTINSTMEIDLYGQGFSEVAGTSWNSGVGGDGDFARGALAAGGLRIVAIAATAHGRSRIVSAGSGRGPVTLGRADIDIVVTEHGAADLRSLSHEQRAASLVAIADPAARDDLVNSWRRGPGRY